MHLRVPDARRKIVALLSFLALQAGLAAGPLRSGAESEPSIHPAAAATPAAGEAASPDVPATSTVAGAPAPVPARTAATQAQAASRRAAPPAVPAPAPSAAPPAPPPAPPAPPPTPPAAALVPPERLYLQPILERAAQQNGIPADLLLAQAWAESSWRIDAVSNVGAVGVLQLTPDTVDFVSKNLLHLDQNLDALDPAANARMATVYLRHLLEKTDGDLRRALMAYNQGLRSLYRDGPVPEAEAYADHVLALRPVFAGGA
ncbi:MAG TPA: transglycosylase SLT domain-containing protein [Acidimicrobiia bacterium]|nr:transglycosylase SLT domain-containing protein [Acidimicrobiia bacterium]